MTYTCDIPTLMRVMVLPDVITALSYIAIPLMIGIMWMKSGIGFSSFVANEEKHKLRVTVSRYFILFAAFMLACGCTHAMDAITVFVGCTAAPAIVFFKVMTAIISAITVAILVFDSPFIMREISALEVTPKGLSEETIELLDFIAHSSREILSTHECYSGDYRFTGATLPGLMEMCGYVEEDIRDKSLLDFVQREREREELRETLDAVVKEWTARKINRTGVIVINIPPYSFRNKVGDEEQGMEEDLPATAEFRLLCKDGTYTNVEASIGMGRRGTETVVVLVMRSADAKRLREEADRIREQARQSIAVRQQYISSIAHDLKTPITTFQLMVDLLEASDINEEQRQLLREAGHATEFMILIVTQAIDVSKMTVTTGTFSGRIRPKVEPVAISNIVKKCHSLVSSYPKRAHIEVRVEDRVKEMKIFSDFGWLWSNTVNMLTNACKFTPVGGTIRLSVTTGSSLPSRYVLPGRGKRLGHLISNEHEVIDATTGHLSTSRVDRENLAHREPIERDESIPLSRESSPSPQTDTSTSVWTNGPYVMFSVSDTGVGIPDKCLERLFKPFSQAQEFQSQGTGLGLFVMAQRAIALGGTYGMISREGSGCEVFFTAPCVECVPVDMSEDSPELSEDSYEITVPKPVVTEAILRKMEKKETLRKKVIDSPKGRVLIVEDTHSVRTMLERALQNHSYEVVSAENGADGLECMKREMYDLCIVDIFMPILDGLECVRRFRDFEHNDPRRTVRQAVIATSANSGVADINACFEAGMDGFVTKPMKLSALGKVLKTTIEGDDSGFGRRLRSFDTPIFLSFDYEGNVVEYHQGHDEV